MESKFIVQSNNSAIRYWKIYLYAKDPYEAKYQLLVIKRQCTGLKHFNYSKTFIQYSNDMCGIYKNIEE